MQAKLIAKYENMKHILFQKNWIVTYMEVHVELDEIYLEWMLEHVEYQFHITWTWSNVMFLVLFLQKRKYQYILIDVRNSSKKTMTLCYKMEDYIEKKHNVSGLGNKRKEEKTNIY